MSGQSTSAIGRLRPSMKVVDCSWWTGDGQRFVSAWAAGMLVLLAGGRVPMCKESVSTAGFTLGCQHFAGSVPRGAGF